MSTYFVLGSSIKVMSYGFSLFPTNSSLVTNEMIFDSLQKNKYIKQSEVLFDYQGNEEIQQGEIYLFKNKEDAIQVADIASQNKATGIACFTSYFPVIEISIKDNGNIKNTKEIQDNNGMSNSYNIKVPVINCIDIAKIHSYTYKWGAWSKESIVNTCLQEVIPFEPEQMESRSKCSIS